MNRDRLYVDPAFPLMTLDILKNIMANSGDPGQLAKYLADEMRELTGARCVFVIQCMGTSHRVIEINPKRERHWVETQEAHEMYYRTHELHDIELWDLKKPDGVPSFLLTSPFSLSLSIPLHLDQKHVGAILLLGLPDEQHIDTVIKLMKTLSKVLALVLRNSLLYKNQDKAIKERTNELNESEERFRIMFERATVATALTLINGAFLKVNKAFCDLLGYSFSDIQKSHFTDIIHHDDIVMRKENLRCLMEEDQMTYRIELRYIHKNGTEIWVDESTALVKDEENLNLYLITSISDISEQKRAQKALLENKLRFQKVFNSQLDAILILDDQKPPVIIECNNATQEIFGYSLEELEGFSIDMLHINSTYAQEFKGIIDSEMADHGFVKDVRFSLRHKNGTSIPTEHVIVEMKNEEDKLTGWVYLIRNIDERIKLETRLQQSQKIEAIGTLAGGIAHDFNNLLSPIMGNAELLKMKCSNNSELLDLIDPILISAERSKDIVYQILSFSRKHAEDKLKPLLLQDIINETMRLLDATIPKTVEMTVSITSMNSRVMGNSTQLTQILVNLITNAYHAVDMVGGKIVVSLEDATKASRSVQEANSPAQKIVLRIRDNGIGIPSDEINKIFDPYFTTKERGKGTGLGLAIVQGIVKNHGGSISVTSEQGVGTEFAISFPLISHEIPLEDNQEKEILRGNETILLVDDEEQIVTLGKKVLEMLGYKVVATSDIEYAIIRFSEASNDYDLLITDMTMPKMSGLQLVKRLREIKPDLPVIICTGYSESLTEENRDTYNIDSVLTKPVLIEEFSYTIRHLLNNHSSLS